MDDVWDLFGDGADDSDGEPDAGAQPAAAAAAPGAAGGTPPGAAGGDARAAPRLFQAPAPPEIQVVEEFCHECVPQTCKELGELGEKDRAETLMSAFLHFKRRSYAACANLAATLAGGAYARLEASGGWDHVAWRELHGLSSMLAAASMTVGGEPVRALRLLDLAVILGAPADVLQPLLAATDAAARIKLATAPLVGEEAAAEEAVLTAEIPAELRAELEPSVGGGEGRTMPLDEIADGAAATTEDFEPFFVRRTPVLLRGLALHWGATRRWSSLAFWVRGFGHRVVPLEIGRHHDAVWREEPLTLRRFAADYLLKSNRAGHGSLERATPAGTPSRLATVAPLSLALEEVGYLAQHALFDQLPALREDFATPTPCAVGEVTRVNVWFGTAETVTPLHYDGYHNVIVQVAGFKYLRLYEADQTPLLYVQGGTRGCSEAGGREGDPADGASASDETTAQGNISRVDVECADLDQFPRFAEARYREVLLRPGDALFMPKGIWHYVRSLTTSISVNFWFEAEGEAGGE